MPSIYLKPDAPLSNNLFPAGIPVLDPLPIGMNGKQLLSWRVDTELLNIVQRQAIIVALKTGTGASLLQIEALLITHSIGIPHQWYSCSMEVDLSPAEANILGRHFRIDREIRAATANYSFDLSAVSAIWLALILTIAIRSPDAPTPPVELTAFLNYLQDKTTIETDFQKSLQAAEDLPDVCVEASAYTYFQLVMCLKDWNDGDREPVLSQLAQSIIEPVIAKLEHDFCELTQMW